LSLSSPASCATPFRTDLNSSVCIYLYSRISPIYFTEGDSSNWGVVVSDWLIASVSYLNFFAFSFNSAFWIIAQIFFNEFAVVPAIVPKAFAPVMIGSCFNSCLLFTKVCSVIVRARLFCNLRGLVDPCLVMFTGQPFPQAIRHKGRHFI